MEEWFDWKVLGVGHGDRGTLALTLVVLSLAKLSFRCEYP